MDPTIAPDATVSSLMALSRYGSAGELLAWLPIVTGHEGLGLCVPWDNTRPMTSECNVCENSNAISESAPRLLLHIGEDFSVPIASERSVHSL